MVRNQSGFTYPLTLCMLILFSTMLMIYMEQLGVEKRMLTETETVLKQDYYLVSTLNTLEESLAAQGKTGSTGIIEFYDGEVQYVITELTDSLWEIKVHLQTGIDNREFFGAAYYDADLKKIIKWVEKN
ncbi:competence type IV pilus minor pilin ComGG [Niallia oryzisoli]|uniref:Competence type IV pilus minor pilin ComGG n=1 Tax=Niallia oryzisoli TaxID=1737571 RepID=A0ABZ2CGB6_9BACI